MKYRILICDRIATPRISAQIREAQHGTGIRIAEKVMEALEQAAS